MSSSNGTTNDRPRGAAASRGTRPAGGEPKVAYVMSRFPKLTETFVLYEMLAVERSGVAVEVFPLLRERADVMHSEAAALVERAHYQPFLSWAILRAHGHFLLHKPRAYFSALWSLLRGTWGSFNFFTGAIGIFPKTVYFARRMAAEGVTHVHAHFASHPAAAAFVIHRLVGIPYSFTGHGSDLHIDRRMLREKVAEAAFVVTISNYNRELILSECGAEHGDKTVVIHCGVDTDIFRLRAADTSQAQRDGRFNIACIGTLHEVKGQTYLIDACRVLRDRGIDFACHFVGDGPDRAALTEQAAEAGLQSQVKFHGQCPREAVAGLLQQAKVLVAPSVPSSDGRREGIPVVLMEAMASGVPVVASRLSGIPELVQHEICGLLAPPRDVDALADAIFDVHQNPAQAARRAEAARQRVECEFDLHRNAAALAELFRRQHSACNAAARDTECLEHLKESDEATETVVSGCLSQS
jgi:glycosyltransferase involved in cell wall biosynthesis